MIEKKIFNRFVGLIIATVLLSGCNKFLDINDNPNNPDKSSAKLLLPTVEGAISHVLGNNMQIYGSMWAQYWTQNPTSSQYKTIDRYLLTNTSFDRTWLILQRNALGNLQQIINKKDESGITQHKAIALILKAYTLQLATDAFGDIPLKEGLAGADYINPKYDPQKEVYDTIFSLINQGKALLNNNDPSKPSTEDLLLKGNMNDWAAFANTLALRAYLRLSQADALTAQNGIKALYDGNASFLTKDVSIVFTTSGGNENPLYAEMVGLGRVQNLVASGTAVKAMNKNNDPRVFSFYRKLTGQDTIAYIDQGTYNENTKKLVSPPSTLVGALATEQTSAIAPVKLISAAESSFLQAEAIARGWGKGDDKALFEKGIVQSFAATGLTTSQANTYISSAPAAVYGSTIQEKIKSIITQKYFAMNGFQGFEAWTEWRRTGFPDFIVLSKAPGATAFPLRFLYPNNELTSNINYPGTKLITEAVWWDK